MILFENVSLSFPNQEICRDLSFQLQSEESLCFSGESGKGKTSLLKLLMGIILPNSGRMLIDGMELNAENLADIRKKMVWLPQNVNLPVDSGKQLIELLQLNADHEKAYHYILTCLGISETERERSFNELSGGQKQRMVLAACLSLDCPIVLLDEPTSSLDDHSIHLLIDFVQSLQGKCIVSTSHNPQWLESCSKIINL